MSISSAEISPVSTPSSSVTNQFTANAPKFGTIIPNRIFVGGIAPNTSDLELKSFFSLYGAVKDTKIISDRAGVSKGYGFVTFETQDDADKVIKNESDNLVFKERKLNIGPAIRKQQPFSRGFGEGSTPPAIMLATNGVPYTFQNGMAVFQQPGSANTDIPQPVAQPATYQPVMISQPMYTTVQPTYAAYQPPTTPATPQWSQWRWTPQAAAPNAPQYFYAAPPTAANAASIQHTPTGEFLYAQNPPYITDGLETSNQTGQSPEVQSHCSKKVRQLPGSMVMDQGLHHTIVTEIPSAAHQTHPPQQPTHYITHAPPAPSGDTHQPQSVVSLPQSHLQHSSSHSQSVTSSATNMSQVPTYIQHHHVHMHPPHGRPIQTYYKPTQTAYAPHQMQRRIYTTPKSIKPQRIMAGKTYVSSDSLEGAAGCLTPPPTPELN